MEQGDIEKATKVNPTQNEILTPLAKQNNSKKILLVILVLVSFPLFALGGYFVGKRSESEKKVIHNPEDKSYLQPTINPTATLKFENEVDPPEEPYQDEYTGWTRYSDDLYNFSFKYPISVFNEETTSFNSIPKVVRKGDIAESDDGQTVYEQDKVMLNVIPSQYFFITIIDNPESLSEKQYWKTNLSNDVECITLEGRSVDGYCYKTFSEDGTSFTETYEFSLFDILQDNEDGADRVIYRQDDVVWGIGSDTFLVALDDKHILQIQTNIDPELTRMIISSLNFTD